jgi:8-oxo-dGTP diphosphatase
MINASGGIIFNKDKTKILLAKRSEKKGLFPRFWSFPGGKVEPGENFEDALDREVKEEFGLKIKKKQILKTSYLAYKDVEIRQVFFLVTGFSGKIKLNAENTEFAWFTPKAAFKLDLAFDHNKILKEFLKIR